ncbi:hypothetical protein GGD56_000381 [Rhizobium mongolense]|uniref:Uncharacterized protein n=1 Tax=Rhizobium mongolense TaxID=57676 RepID=A0ABR6IFB4_9HYPH|nr:hypothetical protein [Rhizobium mongolense]
MSLQDLLPLDESQIDMVTTVVHQWCKCHHVPIESGRCQSRTRRRVFVSSARLSPRPLHADRAVQAADRIVSPLKSRWIFAHARFNCWMAKPPRSRRLFGPPTNHRGRDRESLAIRRSRTFRLVPCPRALSPVWRSQKQAAEGTGLGFRNKMGRVPFSRPHRAERRLQPASPILPLHLRPALLA